LRFDLAVIAFAIAGAALWVEQRHRIDITPPAQAELAPAAACQDSDNIPYSAACLSFLRGEDTLGNQSWHVAAVRTLPLPSPMPRHTEIASPAAPTCPDNDNVPYSANCIRFLSGWYWRMNSDATGAPGRQ
jgi:hypothetical protein